MTFSPTTSVGSEDTGPIAQAEIDRRVASLIANPVFDSLKASLNTYYDDADRTSRMDALLRQMVEPGGRVFDVGSHVGDRVGALRRAGATVLCLEPQPMCAEAIRHIYAGDAGVVVVEAACGAQVGQMTLRTNSANPTVATLSSEFIKAARDADGWREQTWEDLIMVPVLTLDELIARHGPPEFAKIDVEGFEAEVLRGLTTPIASLSFEFTTIQRSVAFDCVAQLERLGAYRFNVSLGETHKLEFVEWTEAHRIRDYIKSLPHWANSGDIYARRER